MSDVFRYVGDTSPWADDLTGSGKTMTAGQSVSLTEAQSSIAVGYPSRFALVADGVCVQNLGDYESSAALSSACPAASNVGAQATVAGVVYVCDGVEWGPDLTTAQRQAAVSGAGNAQRIKVLDADLTASLPAGAAFARAGAATVWDASGNLATVATATPRYERDRYTGRAMGIRFSAAAQQFVRNQAMAGAVAGAIGSGGAWPTNWHTTDSTAGATWTISGTVVRNGITCLRVRLQATTAGAATFCLQMESASSANPAVAAVSQTWIASMHLGVSAGSFAGTSTVRVGITERTSAGAFTAQSGQTLEAISAAAYLAGYFGRAHYIRTLSGGSTARVSPNLMVTTSSAQTIDITFDIGCPEIRQAATLAPESLTTDAVPGDTLSGAIGYGIGAGVLYAAGTASPIGAAGVLAQVDDGTANNRVTLRRTADGDIYATAVSGGSTGADLLLGRWLNDCQGAAIVRWGPQGVDACLSGGVTVSSATAGPARVTAWRAGSDAAGATQWGGTVSAVALDALDATAMQVRTLQPVSRLADDFFRANGAPAAAPGGGAYTVVPYTVSTSAVREPVIASGVLTTPSAAAESATGVTASYLGYDLGAAPKRMAYQFAMADGATNYGNVTIISGALGLGSVANITNGTLHISISDASYTFGTYVGGTLTNLAPIAFARVARDGTRYQAGVRHIGGGMFLAEVPDGRSIPVYSTTAESLLGRYVTHEHYVAKNGATLGVFPVTHAWSVE